MKQRAIHWFVQLLIAVDQLANVLCAPLSLQAWADETISSRCGRLIHRYPYKFYAAVIDLIFYPFQGPDHCINAHKKELTRYQFPPSMRADPTGENQ